ncbi:MAG TPA: four helix bundle protein [Chitinophagales bacterium]|nr:four helix bundle protein [Chitinophagales bacterium]
MAFFCDERMHNFKELKVWQKSRGFVKEVYLVTSKFPPDERFGMTSQFGCAAVSIVLNIAEGAGKNSDMDFSRFLDNAFGSAVEVETLIYLSFDLNFVDEPTQSELLHTVTEIQKIIHSLLQRLRSKS